MNRFIEHFFDIYGTERPHVAPAVDKVPSVEIMEEFNDTTVHRDGGSCRQTVKNKASGRDALPADLIEAGIELLLSPLFSLL